MTAACLVCAGPGSLQVRFECSVSSESKPLPGPSELHLCARCGHLFTTTDLDLRAYYAEQYDATLSDDGVDELVSMPGGEVVFRTDLDFALMKRHAGPYLRPGARIFEFGCGRGRILGRLRKEGLEDLHAFDLSERYRASVERFVDPAKLHIGRRPEGPFDVVCSFFVLEHDVDPVGSLRYLRGVTAPGGCLYLMLPSFVTNVVDLACADHVNHFSRRSLCALLERCGFEPTLVDAESNLGATVALCRPDDASPASSYDDPEMVAYSAAAARSFARWIAGVESLAARVGRGRRVFLYGAGFYAALAHAYLEPAGLTLAGIFDANPRKQGATRLGVTVLAPEAIESMSLSDAALVVCVNPRIGRGIAARWGGRFAEAHQVGADA